MSSSNFLLHRMLVVFLLFCLSKASGGTCLSYGHSCWGGHGKRSGVGHLIGPSQKHTSEWYISKLLDSSAADSKNNEDIFKNRNSDSDEINNFRRSEYQLYSDSDTEKNSIRRERADLETNSKRNKGNSETEESEEEIMVLTPEIQRVPVSKIRLFQVMKQDNNNKLRSGY